MKLWKKWLLMLGLTLGASTAAAAEGASHYALLVGVDNYRADSGVSPLQYASADVEQLSQVLREQGYLESQMTLLADRGSSASDAPTRSGIISAIDSLITRAEQDPAATLLLVFAGHGFNESGESWLCPQDFDIMNPTGTGLPVSAIAERLSRSSIARTYVVIDACRNELSGDATSRFNLVSGLRQMRLHGEREQGTVYVSSCLPGQQSRESNKLGHGVFLHYFAEGIRGDADFNGGNRDGWVSMYEVVQYCNHRTMNFVQNHFGVSQRPWMEGVGTVEMHLCQLKPEALQLMETKYQGLASTQRDELDQIAREVADSHVYDAMASLLAGDRDEFETFLELAVEAQEDHFLANRGLSLVSLLSGDMKGAIERMQSLGGLLRIRVPQATAMRSGTEILERASTGDVILVSSMISYGDEVFLKCEHLIRQDELLARQEGQKLVAYINVKELMGKGFEEAQLNDYQQNISGQARTIARDPARRERIANGIDAYNMAAGIANQAGADLPYVPNIPRAVQERDLSAIPYVGGFF